MAEPFAVTDADFEEKVLNSKNPVLVDFWAEWCGPCKLLTPTIEELAKEYKGKVVIGKLNVDEHSDIAATYGIRSIPSLLFFKKGKVEKQIMGAVSKSEISTVLDNCISRSRFARRPWERNRGFPLSRYRLGKTLYSHPEASQIESLPTRVPHCRCVEEGFGEIDEAKNYTQLEHS